MLPEVLCLLGLVNRLANALHTDYVKTRFGTTSKGLAQHQKSPNIEIAKSAKKCFLQKVDPRAAH